MSTNVNYLLNHYKSSYGINGKDENFINWYKETIEWGSILYLKEFAKLQWIVLWYHMLNVLILKLTFNRMKN